MVRRNCKAKGQQGQLLNFIEAFEDLDHAHIVPELYEEVSSSTASLIMVPISTVNQTRPRFSSRSCYH